MTFDSVVLRCGLWYLQWHWGVLFWKREKGERLRTWRTVELRIEWEVAEREDRQCACVSVSVCERAFAILCVCVSICACMNVCMHAACSGRELQCVPGYHQLSVIWVNGLSAISAVQPVYHNKTAPIPPPSQSAGCHLPIEAAPMPGITRVRIPTGYTQHQ